MFVAGRRHNVLGPTAAFTLSVCAMKAGAARPYGTLSGRSHPAGTTESELLGVQEGGQGAFPRSLIRESGSREEEEAMKAAGGRGG